MSCETAPLVGILAACTDTIIQKNVVTEQSRIIFILYIHRVVIASCYEQSPCVWVAFLWPNSTNTSNDVIIILVSFILNLLCSYASCMYIHMTLFKYKYVFLHVTFVY